MKIIDQFRDPALAVLVNLVADRPKVAAFVGETDVDPAELDALPDTAFAWPEKRAFPIHSAEHAVMSRLYRENTSKVPAHVDDALKQAFEIYEVPDELFARQKVASAPVDPNDYIFPTQRRLPVRSAEQVKLAEEKLLDGYTKIPVANRADACQRLIEKAAEYGVQLNPTIHQLAGFTVSATSDAASWIEARKEAAADPSHKAAFDKLAGAVKRLPAEVRDRSTLVKIATTLDELDQKAGLTKLYDRKLPDPMLTVFNTKKVAGMGVDLGGKFAPMSSLANRPAAFYGDVLGDDLLGEISDGGGSVDPHKLMAVLETLPVDMKQMLAQQMGL